MKKTCLRMMQCNLTDDVFVGTVQRCEAVKRKSRNYQVNNKKRATGTCGADDVSGLQDPTGTKEPLMELGPEPADSIVDSTKTKGFGAELSKPKYSRKERESTVNRSTYSGVLPDCDDDVYSEIVDTSGCDDSHSQSLNRQEPEDSQMELLPEQLVALYPVSEVEGMPICLRNL